MNKSAIIIRAIPFILFVLLTSLQGEWGEASRYWVYILKTGIVGGCIIWLWPRIQEMRPIFSWEAVFAGVVVFILWVGLDPFYPFSFIIVSLLFGFVHQEWIAGVLCGIIYQGLVCWKGRLGDAIVAHGLTNLLLGVWVPWQRAWNFW